MAEIRLGTQGWHYKDWVGAFYPPGTPPSAYLPFYSRVFDAVELDTTFYGPPRPETIRLWDETTPENFRFAAKMPRTITHDKRLIDTEADLVEFLTVMQGLGSKLGPILIELPPSFEASEVHSLKRFLEILPEEFRYSVEFRHKSWHNHDTAELLRRHRIGWTVIDLHHLALDIRLTADFSYLRWLGNRRDITKLNLVQIDRSRDLEDWARRLDEIAEKVQRVYGFMNNHYAGHSPASVREPQRRHRPPGRRPAFSLASGNPPIRHLSRHVKFRPN